MRETRVKSYLVVLFLAVLSLNFRIDPPNVKPVTVYIFLSETCPICQYYTITLNDLYKRYHSKGVDFIGVFPNYDANADSVAAFRKKYAIPFGLVLDKKAALTNYFHATITPEVFIESPGKKILYAGRIDDGFYSLGKRRNVTTAHDLDDVLNAIVQNRRFTVRSTQAVGCLITTSE